MLLLYQKQASNVSNKLEEKFQTSELKNIETLLAAMPGKDKMSMEDLFIIVYCVVSNFIDQIGGQKSLRCSNNNDPIFTDAEVITIALVQELAGQNSQRAWHNFVRKNFNYLFPKICSRTQYGRRIAQLHGIVCWLQQNLCGLLSASFSKEFIIDSFPIELCNIQRLKNSSQPFEYDGADIGYCAAKKLHYYGFKCHLVTDLRGVPVFLCLTSAHMADLQAFEFVAQELLQHRIIKTHAFCIGDKGYLGEEFQQNMQQLYGVTLLSMEREYPKITKKYGPSARNEYLRPIRKIIETTGGLLSVEFNAGRTKRRGIKGLVHSLITKLAAFNLANFLNMILELPLLHVKGFVF